MILGHFVENVEFLCEQSTFRTIGVDLWLLTLTAVTEQPCFKQSLTA